MPEPLHSVLNVLIFNGWYEMPDGDGKDDPYLLKPDDQGTASQTQPNPDETDNFSRDRVAVQGTEL